MSKQKLRINFIYGVSSLKKMTKLTTPLSEEPGLTSIDLCVFTYPHMQPCIGIYIRPSTIDLKIPLPHTDFISYEVNEGLMSVKDKVVNTLQPLTSIREFEYTVGDLEGVLYYLYPQYNHGKDQKEIIYSKIEQLSKP